MATFGAKLKAIRLSRDMSQEDIANLLNTTKQTISRYETEVNSPRLDSVAEIAKRLNIDMTLLINKKYSVNDVLKKAFSKKQEDNAESQNFVALPSDPNCQRLAKAYNAINGEGQGKVADYAEDLDESGRYKRQDDILPLSEDIGAYIMTIGSAAAGSGYENMDDLENYRLIMTTEVPEHDFVLDVEGDSMFPTIYDGDVAFVSKTFDNVSHRIYALSLDGKTVIKRLVFGVGELILISDNPEYDERILSGTALESVRIEGEVVGWETPVK